ncbi:hypothetical protein ACFSE1_14945 [Rhizobium helianthi]|uniref:Uncharacterized protein n=1 Tax=Rhizobium helianthi TaxID=1132695 RepID=A0ABW4M5Z4_9HYPH
MANLLTRLKSLFNHRNTREKDETRPLPHMHVVAPESVTLPFPRPSREQISVPASINGRDLSTGRL